MAVIKTKTYLLTLEESQARDLLELSIKKNVQIQILDPKEMGKEWHDVKTIDKVDNILDSKEVKELEGAIEAGIKKGFVASFEDNRDEQTFEDIKNSVEYKAEVYNIANKIQEYKKNQSNLEKSLKNKSQKNREKALHHLESQRVSIEPKLQSIIHTKNTKDLELLKKELEAIENAEAKIIQTQPHHIKEELSRLKNELISHKVDPDNYSKEALSALISVYSANELVSKENNQINNLFKINSKAKKYFAFAACKESDNHEFVSITNEIGITATEADLGQEVVLWEEQGGLDGFKGIAQNLGSPSTSELNPTTVVAIFFALFFAFCLADAFYALLLAGFTGFFLFRGNMKSGMKSFFRMFFWSSVAAIPFSLLTGSFLGDLAPALGDITGNQEFAQFLGQFQILDYGLSSSTPTRESFWLNENIKGLGTIGTPIVFMLALAAIIGFIHSLVGFILNARNDKLSGDRIGYLSEMNYVFFILLALFWGISTAVVPEFSFVFMILFLISTICLFILNKSKGIFGKIMGGFGKLYGVIGIFADSMSYTRLMAVGLTGGIISMVVNLLALNMLGDEPSFFGWISVVLVLVIGHGLNFVITVFGAYINPLRLHFVEFMPKFFKGEGKAFKYDLDNLKYSKLIK